MWYFFPSLLILRPVTCWSKTYLSCQGIFSVLLCVRCVSFCSLYFTWYPCLETVGAVEYLSSQNINIEVFLCRDVNVRREECHELHKIIDTRIQVMHERLFYEASGLDRSGKDREWHCSLGKETRPRAEDKEAGHVGRHFTLFAVTCGTLWRFSMDRIQQNDVPSVSCI